MTSLRRWSPAQISLRDGVIATALLVGAAAVALSVMGQPWTCRCGFVALWSGDIWSNQNSQQVADPYTFTHLIHGLLFFWLLVPLRRWASLGARLFLATMIEVAWELFENTDTVINRYREATISLDYFGDSILNSSFDVIACIVGFAIASRLPWRASVALMVAMEVTLALTIRDSLLLNIIMLIYPIDAIREWQSAR